MRSGLEARGVVFARPARLVSCSTLGLVGLVGLLGVGACSGPRGQPLEVVLDLRAPTRPISPYVYGVNGLEPTRESRGVFTLIRLGGTRYSTYNWEHNASNAGHDPPANQNDGYLSPSTTPGAPVLAALDRARELGAALLVTLPIGGRVAADRRADGDVGESDEALTTRFLPSRARGGSSSIPDPHDGVVHQDAFVRWTRDRAAERGVRLFFALDNEPAGWPATLPRLRAGRPLTYRELVARSVAYAAMVREEAPSARIFGPVSFGWPELRDLAGAPDAEGRGFLDHYLSRMAAAPRRGGARSLAPRPGEEEAPAPRGDRARLLDVLDVHWYPAVRVEGRSVCEGSDGAPLARARMQLPRSLYDPSYREPSAVADELDGPVTLLPRLRAQAARHARGLELAISEYAYGGGAHASGAVAQADALGAFGREGVFAAAYWPLHGQEHTAALAAFRMFRRVDGRISFGDRALPARSSDLSRLSAWASLDTRSPGRLVLVLVARVETPTSVRLVIRGRGPRPDDPCEGGGSPQRCERLDRREAAPDGSAARRFVLDPRRAAPREEPALRAEPDGSYRVPLGRRSVTTLVFEDPRFEQ